MALGGDENCRLVVVRSVRTTRCEKNRSRDHQASSTVASCPESSHAGPGSTGKLASSTEVLHPVVVRFDRTGTLEAVTVSSGDPDVHATNSARLFERAGNVIPGGVNSPVRAFGSVGGTPRFIREASGYTLTDVDGKQLRRPGVVLGSDDSRARSPGSRRSRSRSSPRRSLLRCADRRRSCPRRGNRRPRRARGKGSPGQLRNRSHDERSPPRPRIHRTHQDHQVLRLLSRPRRRPSRRRRIRPRDVPGCRPLPA